MLQDGLLPKSQINANVTTPPFSAYAHTHAGLASNDNQDAVRLFNADLSPDADSLGYLYAIADGMGGHAHGGVASTLALQTLYNTFYQSAEQRSPSEQLTHAVSEANLRIYQMAQRLGMRMGSTLTAAHFDGKQLTIAHSGDSRAYLIRNGKARVLTTDHTLVGDMVRANLIAPDRVRTHAQRSILTRALGLEASLEPEITQHCTQPGDLLILCTDGVWAALDDDTMARFAAKAAPVNTLGERLIAEAMAKGSDDNLSVVAIRVENVTQPETARGWRLFPFLRTSQVIQAATD